MSATVTLKRPLSAIEEVQVSSFKRLHIDDSNLSHSTLPTADRDDVEVDGENRTTSTRKRANETSARNQSYPCPVIGCDRTFDRPCRRDEHVRTHTGERPFICHEPGCGKSFSRDYHLKRHFKQSHTDERDHVCSFEGCGKSFATSQRLKRHEDAHAVKKVVYRCQGYTAEDEEGDVKECKEEFRKKSTLQAHINSAHLHVSPYICHEINEELGETCEKGFPNSQTYQKHLKDAHGPPTFFCSICPLDEISRAASPGLESIIGYNYAIPTSASISRPGTPASTHTSYSALTQASAFRTQPQLQKHIATCHTDNAPIQMKSSRSNSTLRDPLTEYPCSVSICDKVFSRSNNRDAHVRSVHEKVQRYVCGRTDLSECKSLYDDNGQITWDGQGCGQGFTYKMSLVDHVRADHLGLEKASAVRNRKTKQTRASKQQTTDEGEQVDHVSTQRIGKGASAIELLLGTGSHPDKRKHACLIETCPHRFYREYDMKRHCSKLHDMSTIEVQERLLEKKAQANGQFWYGGIDPHQEREPRPFWYGGIDPDEERAIREFEDGDDMVIVDPALQDVQAMAETAFS